MTVKEFASLAKESRDEHQEQVEVCKHLDKLKVLYYAIPNGGQRYKKTAFDLKKEGVKAGAPDLCICEPNKHYHGLYIEMKRRPKTLKSGKKSFAGISVSESQTAFMQQLRDRGYQAIVCYIKAV